MRATRSTTASQALRPISPSTKASSVAIKRAGTSLRVSKSSKKKKARPSASNSSSPLLSSSRDEIASLKREVRHLKRRKDKRRTLKSCRGRYDSDSSVDSEAGDTPRVPFLHQEGRNTPVIHARFRSIPLKYFKRIVYGTFLPQDLTKLSYNVVNPDNERPRTKDNLRTSSFKRAPPFIYFCTTS